MAELRLKGTLTAADFNPQQGFDGSPVDWDLDKCTIQKEHIPGYLLTVSATIKDKVEYGSRGGSDYAYFWFKETPDEIYGPGDFVEIYEGGEVRFSKGVSREEN